MERRKKSERRNTERRRLLSEKEFRRLIEAGKLGKNDRRSWVERRGAKRRKKQIGI